MGNVLSFEQVATIYLDLVQLLQTYWGRFGVSWQKTHVM